ncbi:MAG: HRDC domain-containing protein, partial [Deltaproteobacteria bacterium]|nr:HRDC domain-containing protein [Deltaproteobacteria bacterium]
ICDIAQNNPGSIRQIEAINGLRKWRAREFGRDILTLLK